MKTRTARLLIAPLLALPLLAAGRSAPRTLDDYTAGLVASPPLTCLPRLPSTGLTAVGDTLVYTAGRSLVYLNKTGGGCEGVARGDALVTVSPQGQLCRGDIARTVDALARVPTGSCALGDFVRYSKPVR